MLTLSTQEQKIVDKLYLHVRDLYNPRELPGHDWQHIEHQRGLWLAIGDNVVKEKQFSDVDPFMPLLIFPCHDLNRIRMFDDDEEEHGLEAAVRARLRRECLYDGLMLSAGIRTAQRHIIIEALNYQIGKNKQEDPPLAVVCNDCDKAVAGAIYFNRICAVGVPKGYVFALPGDGNPKLEAKRTDKRLKSVLRDLAFGLEWDPCELGPDGKPSPFIIRSEVIHRYVDEDFRFLRLIRNRAIEQLARLGIEI